MMEYHLGDACQNTFVLFDRLNASFLDEAFLQQAHQSLIEEKKDDALILFDGKVEGDAFYARMSVLGLDGVIAEFCGNGARVCAAYLFAKFPHFESFFLKMQKGTYPLAKHSDEIYSVKLPLAKFTRNTKFIADPKSFDTFTGFAFVDMLEPHLILQEKLSDKELLELGRRLNRDKGLFPYGINVNAWHILGNGHLYVKTYERGVQRLTQSCGTGSIACAASYQSAGTVSVSTPGGPLEIAFYADGVELRGAAFFFCKNRKERV